MNNRYINSFLITIFLYINLIGIYIYASQNNIKLKSINKSNKRVKITLISSKIIKRTKPTKPKQKKIISTINPKLKNTIKKKSKLKHKINKHKKIIKPKHKTLLKKKATIRKQQIKQNIIKKESIININKKDNQLRKIKQQKYFELIKETIQGNKEYPKKAIRRAIQGEIKVKFIISKNGNLLSITILSGPKIFYKSVKKAIKNSFPINIKDNIFKKDFELELKIIYQLK